MCSLPLQWSAGPLISPHETAPSDGTARCLRSFFLAFGFDVRMMLFASEETREL